MSSCKAIDTHKPYAYLADSRYKDVEGNWRKWKKKKKIEGKRCVSKNKRKRAKKKYRKIFGLKNFMYQMTANLLYGYQKQSLSFSVMSILVS